MTDEKSPDEEIEQAIKKSVEKVEQLALTIRDTPSATMMSGTAISC
ncbi:hypothetical protein [Granulicella sp. L60]|nr:hypothetical protein [Granulicella sp. L60]